MFNVILGAAGGSAIPGAATNDLASAFGSSNRFLGVTVVSSNGVSVPSSSEILPRQQLLSVPFALEAQTAAALISNLANALCPPGSIMAYMGTNPPAGWLFCDGSEASRTTYARLFAVIGTSSGPGDGTNTFHLPDLRAMFLRGVNGSRSNTDYWDPDTNLRTNAVAGGNVGNAVGSVQADEFRAHKHTTTLKWDYANGSGENFLRVGGPFDTPPYDSSLAGGNETRPKNVYVNYIIKY